MLEEIGFFNAPILKAKYIYEQTGETAQMLLQIERYGNFRFILDDGNIIDVLYIQE